MKKTIRKNEIGITLIALIITIIILLILAMVTIRLIINEGILTKAELSVAKYTEAEEYEKVHLAAIDSKMEANGGAITKENLTTALNSQFGEGKYTLSGDAAPFKVTINEGTGKEYTIYDDGKVSYNTSKPSDINNDKIITSEKIQENPSIYYGKNVNYTATVKNQDSGETENITDWKIFYADDNIYLISENFVNSNLLPATTSGDHRPHYTNSGDQPRASFDNDKLLGNYSGSDSIGENNPARKWLSQYYSANYSSTNSSMKAVAYMMDTDTWNQYATDGIAEYAIGGPTLELFAASYNTLHPNAIKIQAVSSLGYRVERDGNMETWNNGLTRDESLYVAQLSDGIVLWLASPSDSNGDSIMNLYPGSNESGAGIGNDNIFSVTNNAFRPVICLKSNVQLELSSDGSTYNIIK